MGKGMECFVTKYDVGSSAGGERVVLEDSIMRKGSLAMAGSKIMEGFVSPLDATVVTRLETAGINIVGKATMDEFGASGLFIGQGAQSQGAESQETESQGAESQGERQGSGAVAAVAGGLADFALCNDYTGAVGVEAAAKGLCYIHPTYGTVSRYGLIPSVPSMDQIGVLCKAPAEGARLLSAIAGHDPKDGAMFPAPNAEGGGPGDGRGEGPEHVPTAAGAARSGGSGCPRPKLRIGLPVNVIARSPDAAAIMGFVNGFETTEFELKYAEAFAPVMQILCCAELCNSINRYDGIKFGYRAKGYNGLHELYTMSRTEAFGPDAKLAAIVGSMVLSQDKYMRYYDKAMRVRRLIKESLNFGRYDAIIMPADAGSESSRFLQALPRLCGLPAVTFAAGGCAMTLIADSRREDMLIKGLTQCNTKQ